MFAAGIRPEARERTPADGKIAGFGRIDGRMVAAVANDFTVLGASSIAVNMKKIRYVKEVANARGLPLVLPGASVTSRNQSMGILRRSPLGSAAAGLRRKRSPRRSSEGEQSGAGRTTGAARPS